jgi:hypothetical protein
MFPGQRLVKLKGLNGRQIAVTTHNITYLGEVDNDGKLVTNVHYHNGSFITAALPLDECVAMLYESDPTDEDAEKEKADMARWRRQAIARAQIQREVDAVVRAAIGGDSDMYKKAGYFVETGPDGSKRITVTLDPYDKNAALNDAINEVTE